MDMEMDELVAEFVTTTGKRPSEYRHGWNIAPTDPVVVVRERDGERQLETVRWGIVSPSSPTFGGGKPVINARIETVATNGLFKGAFTSHRCIVPATGYYEWQQQDDGRQPYFVREPGQSLAMAGIIRAWADTSKSEEDPNRWRLSMAIITRDSHKAPGEVHDRMPTCLTPDAYDDWLGDHLSNDDRLKLLDRTSLEVADDMDFYPVSRSVNSVKNDGPELIQPLGKL